VAKTAVNDRRFFVKEAMKETFLLPPLTTKAKRNKICLSQLSSFITSTQ
jgi:hypothetical protein